MSLNMNESNIAGNPMQACLDQSVMDLFLCLKSHLFPVTTQCCFLFLTDCTKKQLFIYCRRSLWCRVGPDYFVV